MSNKTICGLVLWIAQILRKYTWVKYNEVSGAYTATSSIPVYSLWLSCLTFLSLFFILVHPNIKSRLTRCNINKSPKINVLGELIWLIDRAETDEMKQWCRILVPSFLAHAQLDASQSSFVIDWLLHVTINVDIKRHLFGVHLRKLLSCSLHVNLYIIVKLLSLTMHTVR